MSDTDSSDIDFLSDEFVEQPVRKNDISNIYDIVRGYMTSNKQLQKITLTVEVVEIRDFKGMAFLKVKDDTGSMSAVIYKSYYKNDLRPNNKISVTGRIDVYRGQGQIQLIIFSYNKISDTDNSAFTKLKAKLNRLGYFDNKPILENDYTMIGIISSLNAAGCKDFVHTINARCCNKQLYIYPSSVQGKDASKEICQAIELAGSHDVAQVLVIIRGGGSKEDLECFNSEQLATAIHQSKIPIVTGIGHQIDTSIADLVCARSFITPTAVAQNITAENINSKNVVDKLAAAVKLKLIKRLNRLYDYLNEREDKLIKHQAKLSADLDESLVINISRADSIKNRLVKTIDDQFQYINHWEQHLFNILTNYLTNAEHSLALHQNNLSAGSDRCDQIIKLYEKKCKIIAQPKILDKSGSEIALKEELVKGKIYQICFLDGVYDLKI